MTLDFYRSCGLKTTISVAKKPPFLSNDFYRSFIKGINTEPISLHGRKRWEHYCGASTVLKVGVSGADDAFAGRLSRADDASKDLRTATCPNISCSGCDRISHIIVDHFKLSNLLQNWKGQDESEIHHWIPCRYYVYEFDKGKGESNCLLPVYNGLPEAKRQALLDHHVCYSLH